MLSLSLFTRSVEVSPVTGIPVRMILHEPEQIIGGNSMPFHNLSSDSISDFDSLSSFAKLCQVIRNAYWRCRCPDQFGIACLLSDCIHRLHEPVPILVFGVAPAVKSVIEVDDGKPVLLQQQLQFVNA